MSHRVLLTAGRGGSCEIMIGCIAKALDDELHMDGDEMDDVRWVTKQDAQKAVQYSSLKDSSSAGGGMFQKLTLVQIHVPLRIRYEKGLNVFCRSVLSALQELCSDHGS